MDQEEGDEAEIGLRLAAARGEPQQVHREPLRGGAALPRGLDEAGDAEQLEGQLERPPPQLLPVVAAAPASLDEHRLLSELEGPAGGIVATQEVDAGGHPAGHDPGLFEVPAGLAAVRRVELPGIPLAFRDPPQVGAGDHLEHGDQRLGRRTRQRARQEGAPGAATHARGLDPEILVPIRAHRRHVLGGHPGRLDESSGIVGAPGRRAGVSDRPLLHASINEVTAGEVVIAMRRASPVQGSAGHQLRPGARAHAKSCLEKGRGLQLDATLHRFSRVLEHDRDLQVLSRRDSACPPAQPVGHLVTPQPLLELDLDRERQRLPEPALISAVASRRRQPGPIGPALEIAPGGPLEPDLSTTKRERDAHRRGAAHRVHRDRDIRSRVILRCVVTVIVVLGRDLGVHVVCLFGVENPRQIAIRRSLPDEQFVRPTRGPHEVGAHRINKFLS